eukprot:gene35323-41428_t
MDIGMCAPLLRALAADLDVDVFAPEYPGYGLLHDFVDAFDDGVAAAATACAAPPWGGVERCGVPRAHTVVHGAPFLSIRDAAEVWVGGFLAKMVPRRWDDPALGGKQLFRRIACPLVVMHGELDTIVPIFHGRQLFAAAGSRRQQPAPKRCVWWQGTGHNDVEYHQRDGEGVRTGAAASHAQGILVATLVLQIGIPRNQAEAAWIYGGGWDETWAPPGRNKDP